MLKGKQNVLKLFRSNKSVSEQEGKSEPCLFVVINVLVCIRVTMSRVKAAARGFVLLFVSFSLCGSYVATSKHYHRQV